MAELTRREFVKAAASGMAATGCPTWALGAAGKRKPNVIFVFADQMRAHAMGCTGNRSVITPNLDKLASQGLLLGNAISCSPVCSPYRAQLLPSQGTRINDCGRLGAIRRQLCAIPPHGRPLESTVRQGPQ